MCTCTTSISFVTTAASLETAAIEISLAALVLGHVSLESAGTKLVVRAGVADAGVAGVQRTLRRRFKHGDLPLVAVLCTRVAIDRRIIEAKKAAGHGSRYCAQPEGGGVCSQNAFYEGRLEAVCSCGGCPASSPPGGFISRARQAELQLHVAGRTESD
jgi:hypothetical protein